jgi:TolB protein
MDLDGGNQRRVTNKNGYELTPTFSPDGNYLAFAGDREGHGLDIFLLSRNDPNDERTIVARRFHDASPTFSHDGKRIAFIANSDGNPEIYLISVNGTGLYRLTHSQSEEMTPQFSPDGTALLFASKRKERFAIYELAF